jgi:hypothetical protein
VLPFPAKPVSTKAAVMKSLRVIDARADTSILASMFFIAGGPILPVFFRHLLSTELTGYFHRATIALPGSTKLRLKIFTLEIDPGETC